MADIHVWSRREEASRHKKCLFTRRLQKKGKLLIANANDELFHGVHCICSAWLPNELLRLRLPVARWQRHEVRWSLPQQLHDWKVPSHTSWPRAQFAGISMVKGAILWTWICMNIMNFPPAANDFYTCLTWCEALTRSIGRDKPKNSWEAWGTHTLIINYLLVAAAACTISLSLSPWSWMRGIAAIACPCHSLTTITNHAATSGLLLHPLEKQKPASFTGRGFFIHLTERFIPTCADMSAFSWKMLKMPKSDKLRCKPCLLLVWPHKKPPTCADSLSLETFVFQEVEKQYETMHTLWIRKVNADPTQIH